MTDPISRLRELEQEATPRFWVLDGWDNSAHMSTYGIVTTDAKKRIAVLCNCEDAPNSTDEDWDLVIALRNSAKEIIELMEALRDTDNLANLTSREVASAYDSLIAKLSQT